MTEVKLPKTELSNIRNVFDKQKVKSLLLRVEAISKRKERLRKLRKWILGNEQRIFEAVHQDLGKPLVEVKLSEIRPCLAEIRLMLHNLDLWTGNHYVGTPISFLGTRASYRYEPKGVSLIIAPWNFPFNLTITPLIASLAAGNTAILKPSERTMNTSLLIQEMITQIFSNEEVSVVIGGPEISQELVQFPFDHIFFTGSSRVGKEVMKAAAKNLSSVTLELGGKTPTIIDKSANLNDAADKIVWGKFLNCGQTCIAPDYLLVQESVKEKLIDLLKVKIQHLFGGDKKEVSSSPDYGKIVDQKHLKRLGELLQDAMDKGAKIITGGKYDFEYNFMEPTVMDEIADDTLLMKEEIFGPILPVLSYQDLKEVVKIINSKPKPLALYIFSSQPKNIQQILASTSSGSAVINDCVLQYSHPYLAFGGVNDSGLGKSHGLAGFQQFSNQKPVLKQRIGATTLKMLYPPYRGLVNWWSDIVTKYF